MTRRRLFAAIAMTAAVPLLVAGCAKSDVASSGSSKGGSGAVKIDFTDDGCAPVPATVEAGPLSFAITNKGAGRVTEAEVMQDGRILAEKENLTPGLSGQFSLRLEAGEYVIYCPNAKQDRSTLTVKAAAGSTASATTDASLTAAVTAYRGFLQNRADALLPSTKAFAAAVKAGNIAQAKKLFAPARANYEAIEPVAESFGDLDPEIDARVNDVSDPTTWSGFHRIEKALWADKNLAGMDAYADKLVTDVSKLVELIPTAKLQPANIANGAVDLLGEVANSKITGEEDRYSHTDLWDFEANVAGVREAIDVLSPALRQRDPELLSTANSQFAAVLDALSKYKTADGYVDYSTVGKAERRQLTRRVFLGGSALLGVGAAGGAVGTALSTGDADASELHGAPVPFYGVHQAGIDTAAQDRLAFAAFDLMTDKKSDVQELLREWTKASIAMCAGSLVPGSSTQQDAPPADTGEAQDLPPSKLTITAGLGPSLFDRRFGLAARKPAALQDIPALPRDDLDVTRSHGDIGIQACSNDPQVAFHAIRNLARIGRGVVSMRWSQLGFGRTSSTSTSQATPRNLMGFKDGTRNVHAEDANDMDSFVWVGAEGDQAWMRGGSYLVSRRIRMRIEGWDRDFLQDQEAVIGRVKTSGAPLGGHHEFDPPNFTAKGSDGELVIPVDAHVRLAAHEQNGGLRILRRGYSFTDGTDPDTGELDAGLFFICYQKDPRKQFVPLQRKLGLNDALNEYIEHNSSAVFACPPGVRNSSDYWASALFA